MSHPARHLCLGRMPNEPAHLQRYLWSSLPATAQSESLHKLAQAIDATPDFLAHERDVNAVLAALKAEFATLEDFEREFPSLCFALATGVGKTRLMGAFISYLHLAHGFKHFFVMAPNLTITTS